MKITVTPRDVRAELEALGRITAGKLIRESELSEADTKALTSLFRPWKPGEAVKAGELRRRGGDLYECLQEHTTQADWKPDVAKSLWKIRSAPGVIPIWVQPTGAHDAYNLGAQVQWPDGETVWESTMDGNATEPGTFIENEYWVEVT